MNTETKETLENLLFVSFFFFVLGLLAGGAV